MSVKYFEVDLREDEDVLQLAPSDVVVDENDPALTEEVEMDLDANAFAQFVIVRVADEGLRVQWRKQRG